MGLTTPRRKKPARPPQLMPIGESFTIAESFFKALLIYTASTRKLAFEGPSFVGSKPIAQCDSKTRLRRTVPDTRCSLRPIRTIRLTLHGTFEL